MDDTGQTLGSGYYTNKFPVSKDVPLPGASPRQSLDDSNLVFRRRSVERSDSCLLFTTLESPSIENITSENISNRSRKNYPESRADDPNDRVLQDPHGPCQAPIKRPNKNALGVTSHTRSRILSGAEQESSLATTKHKADHESLLKKKKHEKKTGLHSNTGKIRPDFGTSSVPDTEALATAENMRERELLMPRTTRERSSDGTFSKAKVLNKSFGEAWRPTEERKVAYGVQSAGLLSTGQSFDSGPVLKPSQTKKTAESDGFFPRRTSSFEPKTDFTVAGSSVRDKTMSKSTYPGLLDFEEPIDGRECRHMKRSTRAQFGAASREGSVASGVQFQRSKHGISAKAFPPKNSFSQNPLNSTDNKHFQGESATQNVHHNELQRPHGAKDSKGSALPALKKEVDRRIKPNLLVEFIEGLVRTFVNLLRSCSKRTSLVVAPTASTTRENFFLESPLIINFRSWITFWF